MTAPDMVSLIEKVLAAHQPFSSHWDHPREMVNTASCDCGNLSSGAEQPDALHAAHQARAVMAAISEAGAVEWGWEYRGLVGGEFDRRITRNWTADRALTREEAQSEVDNMNSRHPNIARLIHRNATAWTAVEG